MALKAKTMQSIMLSPAAAVLGGAFLGTIIGLAGGKWWGGIGSGILGSLSFFLLQEISQGGSGLREIEQSSSNILNNLKLSMGLKELRDLALSLPLPHLKIYSEITEKVSLNGGAIIIGAQEENYISYLGLLLKASKDSFCSIVRGGENPKYPLEWFFADSPGLSHRKRIKWLEDVRDANLQTKIRLLLFSEKEVKPFFKDREKRKILLEAMLSSISRNPGEVYQIDPFELLPILGSDSGDEENRIVFDDFAIFDHEILLKHNGAASLTTSIKDQIRAYLRPFLVFDNRSDIFKKITLTHFGTETWEEWENKVSNS
ncbi:hypothetical protein ACFLRW_02145 [Acidobacteriota bacterium]